MVTSALRACTNLATRFHIINVSCVFSIVDLLVLTSECPAVAALAYFNRTLYHYDIATGEEMVSANFTSSGPANATHTNSYVSLTTSYVQAFPSPIYPATTMGY